MSKVTTTLEEILRTSAKKADFDDFFDNQSKHLIRYGDELALLNQVTHYTPLVKQINDRYIFGGFTFDSSGADEFFKKMFLNYFLNREIGLQTLDIFRIKLVGLCGVYNQYISNVYEHYADFIGGGNDSTTHRKDDSENNFRGANVTLPQDNAKLDLTDMEVEYADTTDANRSKTETTGDSETTGHNYNAAALAQMQQVYQNVLDQFDKKLFLQIW